MREQFSNDLLSELRDVSRMSAGIIDQGAEAFRDMLFQREGRRVDTVEQR